MADDDEFTADGEDPREVEGGTEVQHFLGGRIIHVGSGARCDMKVQASVDAGETWRDIAPMDGEALRAQGQSFGVGQHHDESDDAYRARLVAGLSRRDPAGSLADIRAQLAEFVYGAIPVGVHVEGLVITGPYDVSKGWRRWAMRLGLWLLRKSGCQVVKP